MADDIREYVRAAQAAELRGDVDAAVEMLTKAAVLYRGAGKPSRALAMLRHAQRIAPARRDLEEEIHRLEWLPERPLVRAFAPDGSLEEEMRKILAPLELAERQRGGGEDLPGEPGRQLIERGPTRSDPALSAWCSFCCRPTREVGPLVAGPAGAFVCADCIRESARLLELPLEGQGSRTVFQELLAEARSAIAATAVGGSDDRGVVGQGAPAGRSPEVGGVVGQAGAGRLTTGGAIFPESRRTTEDSEDVGRPGGGGQMSDDAAVVGQPERGHQTSDDSAVVRASDRSGEPASVGAAASGPIELPHQAAAYREIEQALKGGRRRILLVGPAGSGKTLLVRRLESERRGFLFRAAQAPRSLPSDWLLLVDESEPLEPGAWRRLEELLDRHAGQALISLRGCATPRAAVAWLLTDDARLPLPATGALRELTENQLPLGLAERMDALVILSGGDRAGLAALADALLRERGFPDDLVAQAAPLIAAAAESSGRSAHEVRALVGRIPPGCWRIEVPEAYAASRPRARRKPAQRKAKAT